MPKKIKVVDVTPNEPAQETVEEPVEETVEEVDEEAVEAVSYTHLTLPTKRIV